MSDAHSTEHWLPIPGYPSYEVSDKGQVRSYWTRKGAGKGKMIRGAVPHIISQHKDPRTGHLHVTLALGWHGSQKSFQVARLVLMAFVRPPKDGECALHTDDPTPGNVNLWNLRWGTFAENHADQVKHHGKHALAKLNVQQVKAIRERLVQGDTLDSLATEYGVSLMTMSLIRRGKIHRQQEAGIDLVIPSRSEAYTRRKAREDASDEATSG